MKHFLLPILSLALLFSACNDQDDKDEQVPDANESRVIKETETNSFGTFQTDYIYDGKDLAQTIRKTMGEKGEWDIQYKTDFSKSGDEIIWHRSDYIDSTWVDSVKQVRLLDGDNISEYKYFVYLNGQWVLRMRWTYEYENNRLVRAIAYNIENGDYTPSNDYLVNYSDGKISNYFNRQYNNGEWENVMKFDYVYDGSQLSYNIFYMVNEEELTPIDKWEYFYEDDKLIMDKSFTYYNDTWNEFQQINYMYDVQGNLINVSVDNGEVREYEYESGEGNAGYFLRRAIDDLYIFPDITKGDASIHKSRQKLLNNGLRDH